jgi:hypothetical protein
MNLYEMYESLGANQVEGFVNLGQEEDLSLEFKTLNDPKLRNKDDRRNLGAEGKGRESGAG